MVIFDKLRLRRCSVLLGLNYRYSIFVPSDRESCAGKTDLFNEHSAAAQERAENEKIACNS